MSNNLKPKAFAFLSYIAILAMMLSPKASSQGSTWRLIPGTENHGTTAISIYGPNPDTVYAVGVRKFLRSINGGRSWDSVSQYRTEPGAILVDPFDSKHVFLSHNGVSISGNDVSISTDAGQNWMLAFLGSGIHASILELDPSGSGAIYVGVGASRIYRTVDRGMSWTQLANPLDFLWSLSIAASNDSVLYAGCRQTGWKSSNGGNSWTQLSFGFQVNTPVKVLVDPRSEDVVFAAMADRGVYKSTDGGATWIEMNNGIPSLNRTIVSIAINPKKPDEVFVGVSASGDIFYRSSNGGASWLQYSDGLPSSGASVDAIAIDTTNNRIFLGITGDLEGMYSNDSTIVSVEDSRTETPLIIEFLQNYPNPFNPSTRIIYRVLSRALVSLKIYDVLGREITTLVDEQKAAGEYATEWKAEGMSNGVYYYRLTTESPVNGMRVSTKKMILIR